MNIEQARFNMIEQQIRPWDVLNPEILQLLSVVKRENFVPEAYKHLAFADFEIPLSNNQHMLSPKVEARVLQELNITPEASVLEIGAGSGYMAALLAHQSAKVLTIESHEVLAEFAKENLLKNGVSNAEVALGNGASGWSNGDAHYDIIVVSGALPILPQTLLEQIKVGGRMSVFVGEAPLIKAQIVTRQSENEYHFLDIFETFVTPLEFAQTPSKFKF